MTLYLYNYIIIQNLYLYNYSDVVLTTRHIGVSVIFPFKLSERCVASKGHIIVNYM